jgi:hypothetical protein
MENNGILFMLFLDSGQQRFERNGPTKNDVAT